MRLSSRQTTLYEYDGRPIFPFSSSRSAIPFVDGLPKGTTLPPPPDIPNFVVPVGVTRSLFLLFFKQNRVFLTAPIEESLCPTAQTHLPRFRNGRIFFFNTSRILSFLPPAGNLPRHLEVQNIKKDPRLSPQWNVSFSKLFMSRVRLGEPSDSRNSQLLARRDGRCLLSPLFRFFLPRDVTTPTNS